MNNYYYIRKNEEDGLVVSMNNIVERHRTELNLKLQDYFDSQYDNYQGIWDDQYDLESVLWDIWCYLDDNQFFGKSKYEIDFSTNEHDIYIIPITKNLELILNVVDVYHGDGEYEKYIEASKFIINEETTEKDVDKLIEFINENFIFNKRYSS